MSTKATIRNTHAGQPEWSMPWVELPIHDLMLHHVSHVAAGLQNLVITGPAGVGKSQTVLWALQQFAKREKERLEVRSGEAQPRGWIRYASGTADGRKTALRDLLAELGHRVNFAQSKHLSVRDFTKTAIEDLQGPAGKRNIRIVCIDEADRIDAANLEDLRQVIDEGEARDYPIGMILIGNDKVAARLRTNRELGQRFSLAITIEPFTDAYLRPVLTKLHPDLEALSQQAGWDGIADQVLLAANGRMRRLERFIHLADGFARRKKTPINGKAIQFAVRTMA